MTNPRCFLDLSVDGEPVGRVIFELFADKVPKTAEKSVIPTLYELTQAN